MITPAVPADEAIRLRTLRSLDLLDTPPEERFDRLTRLSKRLFGVPIALVSLVDANRQWFKSCDGLAVPETPRDVSFCGHAINGDDILVIPDALFDPRFHDNPLVTGEPHIRFYAGCPLSAPDGSKVGTLCLLDSTARQLDAEELVLFRDLGRMAEQELAAVQLATTDELTRLSNRRGFAVLAQHTLELCVRMRRPVSMLFFDLDGFKSINDRFGHAEGDRALTGFARVLLRTFRNADVIGRMGGDEFAVLMTDCPESELHGVGQRLRQAMDAYDVEQDRGYRIRFSMGFVSADLARLCSVEALLASADRMMYERKRAKAG
jgi:diguanylate cyclase (GGDEF)-like protein